MPEQPIVRVFVSSTRDDLEPEREAVAAAVRRMRDTDFVGMEDFDSRDETPLDASLEEVDRSDVYVGIFGGRYGSGITEAEYRRAGERGMTRLVYLKNDKSVAEHSREADPEKGAKLGELKAELGRAHIISAFDNADELATKVAVDLHNWLFKKYLTPKLEQAVRGVLSHSYAQMLLDGIRDFRDINQSLLADLRGAGFNVASGERSVAFSGDAEQIHITTGDTNVFNAPTPIIPTLHQLRAPVGDFVGRGKEIADLVATLRGGGSAAISGISGMGGIGKTELAYYVANKLRDAYPDAQLVVDMRGTDDQPRDPADALAACIRAFVGIEQRLPDDMEELTRLYRSVLEGKRALILLDNASDGAQVRPLLPPAGSALLVTSRRAVALPHMTRVTLDQLQPTEARELLTSIAPRVAPDIVDRICYLCGYLPLAIRAAGSLLDVTVDLDPTDYAAQLGDERTRLERIGTEGVDVSVEASFNLSYARLDPDAARAFRQLAVFPASFDARAEEKVCEDEDHRHLSDLLRRSLVLYDAVNARYRLHDLMRLFADARLSGAECDAAHANHAVHYMGVLDEAQQSCLQGEEGLKRGLALFDAEWRNIQAGWGHASRYAPLGGAPAYLCSIYVGFGAELLQLRLHPREYIRWLETALAAARLVKQRFAEVTHVNSAATTYGEATNLANLGVAYFSVGDIGRAIECHMQAAKAFQEIGHYEGAAAALCGFGRTLINLGMPRNAIEIFTYALAVSRETNARRLEGNILSNLGAAYEALGEIDNSIKFHEEHLKISRETGDARAEGTALCNLSSAYYARREMRRAAELSEQALDVFRAINDRHGEVNAWGNLAGALVELGDYRRAVECCQQQFIIARELGNPNEEGKALGTLGNAYADLGEIESAIGAFGQAATVFRSIGNRRGEAAALWNQSLALDRIGHRIQAIAHAEAALEIAEQTESPSAEKVRAQLAQWRGEA